MYATSSPISSSLQSRSSSSSSSSPQSSITSLFDELKNTHLNIPKKVIDACKKTDFPSECSTSVGPLLLDGQYEPLDILKGEAKALTHALEVVKEDMSKIWSEERTAITCKEMYENAREEITKAMELARRKDKYGVNVYLSGALTYIDTCKDELPQDVKDDSPMILANKFLSNLATNCLALANFAM
ncbi:hypothetical protein vseg_003307 [Gypsophila vaccaria]